MKKYLLLAALIAITRAAFAQLPIDSIKAIIRQEVAAKRSKSIIVGIIDAHGRQIFSDGIISDKKPVQPDSNTVYKIGSITKVFTTVLLADMSLKQQLNINDPISKFLLASVKAPARNGKEISLLNLATHRAGFPRNAWNIDPKNVDNPFADYTLNQLYEYIAKFELRRDIDSRWQYSNVAYTLLGHALAITAHKDFGMLLEEDICKPLNMRRTVLTSPAKIKLKNIAPGHTEYGKPAIDWDFPSSMAGGGGLCSSVNDMLNFAAANLGLIETPLTPAMELSHQQQAKKDGTDYYMALGWTLWNEDGRNIVFKDGATGGTSSFLGIDKKNKIAVVVLTNSNNLVTDIGLHILDTTSPLKPYKYPWHLLDTLRATVKTKGIATAIQLYQQLKTSKGAAFTFDEKQLNHLGNELRKDKKIKDAIKIYELNAKEYPKSTLVYESLGETYKRNGNKKLAITYFEKLVEMDPENPHWNFILNKLKTNGPHQ